MGVKRRKRIAGPGVPFTSSGTKGSVSNYNPIPNTQNPTTLPKLVFSNAVGNPITMSAKGLNVPDDPILPFIEGDGTGPDIWNASVHVFDEAVKKAYGGKRKIEWKEVLAGEKAFNQTGN